MAEGARRASGIRTREAILEASLQLFLHQGFHATSMREIARQAGVSLGAAYNHFASKEQILQQLLAEHNLYAAVSQGLAHAQGKTAEELLRSGFHEVMARVVELADFPKLLFIDVLEFQGRDVAPLVLQVFPEFMAFFTRVNQLGLRTGEMREMHPLLLARSFMSMVISSFILEFVSKMIFQDVRSMPLKIENWEERMMDVLLHGALTGSPRREA